MFRICSWNIGADLRDHNNLLETHGVNFEERDMGKSQKDLSKPADQAYEEAERNSARSLSSCADVFFLQEGFTNDRPLLQTLKEKNFSLYSDDLSTKPSKRCIIAISNEQFKNITLTPSDDLGKGLLNDRYVVITATHKQSDRRFAFVSGHITGFNLEGSEADKHDGAYIGDGDCCRMIEILNSKNTPLLQIIGADMNTSPENWPNRFQYFTTQGFDLYRTGTPTNVFPKSKQKERELDYFITRHPKPTFLKSAPNLNLELNSSPFGVSKTDATNRLNPSDHKPIVATVTIREQPSLLWENVNKIAAVSVAAICCVAVYFLSRKK